ncbi:ORF46 [Ostreid herpesvirus 1]|uniref:Uncharacterized protein ORF46 n=1 Tax=Ostreid herpesvirus 1 (isolate France) TaxID=654903 RepID=Y046_OSHVF|nr:ORF46 [Ostreid herpesvirus 1]Q6R7H8.1 RecName: Full=Uncharacterized protein ORF46 [Ostreid herpesvirus 1 (isolate France)]AAS00937.1 ORF46 [Ostreid herpesvirus 1]ASK05575.1 ORF46 [Ostreid herpesvirus 1]ASK05704.1 ORF46 [Ostreid herpesvirus 1]AVL26974.1 ORF46 [Ostreid herpesvirus 1]AVQ67824.1 ORF46 [Ostreid herpesvirus 1]
METDFSEITNKRFKRGVLSLMPSRRRCPYFRSRASPANRTLLTQPRAFTLDFQSAIPNNIRREYINKLRDQFDTVYESSQVKDYTTKEAEVLKNENYTVKALSRKKVYEKQLIVGSSEFYSQRYKRLIELRASFKRNQDDDGIQITTDNHDLAGAYICTSSPVTNSTKPVIGVVNKCETDILQGKQLYKISLANWYSSLDDNIADLKTRIQSVFG